MPSVGAIKDMKPVSVLRDMIAERDTYGRDELAKLNKDDFSPEKTGRIVHNPSGLALGTDAAWSQFGRLVRVPGNVLADLEPGIVQQIIDERFTDTECRMRYWDKPGEEQVRAIVSKQYAPIAGAPVLDDMLKRIADDTSELRVNEMYNGPEMFRAEIIDPRKVVDEWQPGKHVNIDDENAIFTGTDIRLNDVGSRAATIDSYLWRMWCANGAVVAIGRGASMRAIHKGAGDWRGALMSGEELINSMIEAQQERIAVPSLDEFAGLIKANAHKPRGAVIDMAMLTPEMTKAVETKECSRWDMAQSFARVANMNEGAARSETQEYAGSLIAECIEATAPALARLVM